MIRRGPPPRPDHDSISPLGKYLPTTHRPGHSGALDYIGREVHRRCNASLPTCIPIAWLLAWFWFQISLVVAQPYRHRTSPALPVAWTCIGETTLPRSEERRVGKECRSRW